MTMIPDGMRDQLDKIGVIYTHKFIPQKNTFRMTEYGEFISINSFLVSKLKIKFNYPKLLINPLFRIIFFSKNYFQIRII